MVKCTECKYHLDSPIDYVIDGLTGEKLVEWGHYCPIHEQLYGIELEEKYYKIAEKRISDANKQTKLF